MYQAGNGIWGRVFAVPNEIVDNHLKLCGAVSLKVLLLLLRRGEPMDSGQLATLLGQSAADIQDAVNYWVENGIISHMDSPMPEAAPAALPEPVSVALADAPAAAQREEELPQGNKIVHLGRRRRLSMPEVNELAQSDRGMRGLLGEAQAAFARPLKPMETESIATIYAQYELPPDIILMILHYSISIGKISVTQLEKMAADWYARDINTHEKAEQELIKLTRQSEMENTIRATLGIYGRRITEKENTFFRHWMDELRINTDLIRLAYEHTADVKGKLSFPDINRVLTKWHENGIKTTQAAILHIKESAANTTAGTAAVSHAKSKEKPAEPKASYDLERFEEILSDGSIWD